MPRKPRFVLPGVPQHVNQRGNNREPCFYAEEDYRRYLDLLTESADHNRCRIHAYVLMTNHVHLLAMPSVAYGLSRMMQDLGRKSTCATSIGCICAAGRCGKGASRPVWSIRRRIC